MFSALHDSITTMPVNIRNEICEGCSWSIPTYYRKVKGTVEGKSSISKTEAGKILFIIRRIYTEQLALTGSYERK